MEKSEGTERTASLAVTAEVPSTGTVGVVVCTSQSRQVSEDSFLRSSLIWVSKVIVRFTYELVGQVGGLI